MTGVVGNTEMCDTTPFDTRGQYVYWFFTLNNYVDGDVERLIKCFDQGCHEYRFQAEEGEETKTPHLQGVCHFKGKIRLSQLKTYYSKRAQWKPSRSEAANAYCVKAETRIAGPWIKLKPEKKSKKKKQEEEPKKPILTKKVEYETLRENQKEIAKLFTDKCDEHSRAVCWFWDKLGDWGKTYLVKYLIDNCGAIMLSGGSKDAINGVFSYIKETETVPNIIIFDIPRCNEGHVSYNAIEQIKNGCIFNSKYETGMLRFDTPHVVVFANEEPEYTKLSRDRWRVVELEHEKKKISIPDYYKTI
ncbi:MAG: hypothetical protein H7836_17020 [Magnetococcus sp. YQC-3]